jgi:speckle-type POZ protein
MTANDESSEPAWTTAVFKKISTLSREIGKSVTSETFKHEDTSWKVKMYIDGTSEQSKNHCSIYLVSSSAVKASYSIKLVNPEHEKRSERLGPDIHFFKADIGCGCHEFTTTEHLLDPIDGFLLDDTITVQVQIIMLREIKVNGTDCSMSNAMQTLLFDTSTSDCLIVFKNKSRVTRKRTFKELATHEDENIPVHKFILQLRSPIFKAMLSSTMKESTSSEIIISDFDHDVVKEFITFLYLDTCDTRALGAKSLLAIAHKYEVKGLMQACELDLIKMLSISNVVELLIFADLYESNELKIKALTFIKNNLKVLTKTGHFYESLSPELLHKVFCQLSDL